MSEILVIILIFLVDFFGFPTELKKIITQENIEIIEDLVNDTNFGNRVGEPGGIQETAENPDELESNLNESQKVNRVIDGDTIELENGQKVRYIGINTPETKHPFEVDGCFGKEASEFNQRLVEGKVVRLEKDVSEIDRYGRLLRYIYVDDIFVNEYLVREGYAVSSSFPPDVKYQEKFIEAEKLARENQKGLWGTACDIRI